MDDMQQLIEGSKELGVNHLLDTNKYALLLHYKEKVLIANNNMNLTSITDYQDFINKHLLDSLSLYQTLKIKPKARVLDVGTGAGFPGVVLAITTPLANVTLLDASAKRLNFIDNTANSLGIFVSTIHMRAEDAGKDLMLREQFDIVCARAVAKLPVLLEYCLPLLAVGGYFAAMKGPEGMNEATHAQTAASLLGATLAETIQFTLPFTGEKRCILLYEKVTITPGKYPRKSGKPTKKPL